ncbi:MAG: hypothetical protein PWQ29_161 [Verrucomicrobiota bacterium]|jgi:Icc-related predicted phosphoesterase|nr:hypothetical protein [Verrucomicrobiota bacterium]MDK2962767.1 hypothetical protein [Verrucomicrobiota bacterium]
MKALPHDDLNGCTSLLKKQISSKSNAAENIRLKNRSGTTKILCVSDTVDPLVYSNNIRERFRDIDFIISGGDLHMKYYGYIVSNLNKPLYFVFGNHHLKHFERFKKSSQSTNSLQNSGYSIKNYFGSICIGDKVIRDKKSGLIIAGLGGSIRYNTGRNQFTDIQMYLRIFRLIPKMLIHRIFHGRWLDILVTHAPPYGIHDCTDRCHVGFKAFLWFMKMFKPKYLLHGHVHLYNANKKRETDYLQTRVINVYGKYVLNL